MFLPLNSITENLGYIDENGNNQRIVISAFVPHPAVWKISKVETTRPIGILKITVKEDFFNPNLDYVDLDLKEMYADYYYSNIMPVPETEVTCSITCSTNIIKCGGSYKLLTFIVLDADGTDITSDYTDLTWSYSVDDVDVSELITEKPQATVNKMRIKFADNTDYLMKILKVTCKATDTLSATIEMNIESI